jgi:hypothetical protein
MHYTMHTCWHHNTLLPRAVPQPTHRSLYLRKRKGTHSRLAALTHAQRPAVSRLVVEMLTPNLMFTQPPALYNMFSIVDSSDLGRCGCVGVGGQAVGIQLGEALLHFMFTDTLYASQIWTTTA